MRFTLSALQHQNSKRNASEEEKRGKEQEKEFAS